MKRIELQRKVYDEKTEETKTEKKTLQRSTVYSNVEQLEKLGLLSVSGEEEYRGHIKKLYRLSLSGLFVAFDSEILKSENDVFRAINNYESVHQLFPFLEKLEKITLLENNELFLLIIRTAARAAREHNTFSEDNDDWPRKTFFTLQFIRFLYYLNAEFTGKFPEIYGYLKYVIDLFRSEFDNFEKLIEGLN